MPDSICCDFHLRCTGCEACAQSCPIACVSMERDDEGFPYPLIDKKRCVECGLCVRACPNNRSLYVGFFQQAWAFQERRGEALRSSSGGAFHALAVQVVEGGGVVYGFAFERGGAVAMRRAESVDELECLRGSKYVQGSMAGMYPRIARDVDEGVPVLVSGTGCQIAGVRSFRACSRDNGRSSKTAMGIPLCPTRSGISVALIGDSASAFVTYSNLVQTSWEIGSAIRSTTLT